MTLRRLPRNLCLSILALALATPLFGGRLEITSENRDKLRKETRYAIDVISNYHYKQTKFPDLDARAILTAYLDDLDFNRMFLLQDDVDFIFERFENQLKPTYLFVGDLYPALEVFNLYYDRVNARLDWIEKRLEGDFDFSADESFAPDREDAPWPADKAAADALWEARLKFELIAELLEEETLETAKQRVADRYSRMRKFIEETEISNVQEVFLTSLAGLYDPHTNFFSWDSAQEFDIQISNSLVGIGAQLRDIDGQTVIERLIPGGPAELSGKLHPGDKIVGVAQGRGEFVNVEGMKLRKIVQMIRGEEGTTVRLNIVPANDSSQRNTVVIIREKVELTANLASASVYEMPLGEDRLVPIGVIELPSFYGAGEFGDSEISTTRNVEELITKLKEIGIEGLVLDLRNNGGGRLDEAVRLTGLFIPEGPVVQKKDFQGSIQVDSDPDPGVAYAGPLVILVSKNSASASEIVAGALQAMDRAIVVGDGTTHGKGTVQAPIDLRDFMRRLPWSGPLEVGTVKVTVQKYYLPNGSSTQNKGVVADIRLPSVSDFVVEGEAELDNALDWDTIEPAPFSFEASTDLTFVSDPLLEELALRSERRQTSLPEFDFLNRTLSWLRERHEEKVVSLNLEQRRAERIREKSFRDEMDAEKEALDRLALIPRKVDLDLTVAKQAQHQDKLAQTPLPDGRSRANQFYQKVFYYQDPETQEIQEIWVEYLDYEDIIRERDAVAAMLSEVLETEVSPEKAEQLLLRYKNMDRSDEFDAAAPFLAEFPDQLDREAVEPLLTPFFAKLVEINDDILEGTPRLDIPLRESLRVVADWLEIAHEQAEPPTRMAVSASADMPAPDTSRTP